jgi:hypothetical protein
MNQEQQTKQPVWKRPKHAIRIFGISPATLYRWIENETVRTQKIQGCRFVDVSEFLSLEPAPRPDPAELLKHAAECEEEGRRAHKHSEELEAYVARRSAEDAKHA